MENRRIAALGLLLTVASASLAEEPAPDQDPPNGKFRVQVVQGSFEAVFGTSVIEALLVPMPAIEGEWVFSDGKLQRIRYYFSTPDRTPPLKLSDEDVASITQQLGPRLGKKMALQFAHGMQQQFAADIPQRIPCTPRLAYLSYHVKYDGEQSPAYIDLVEDVDSVIPKDGPKIGVKRTYRGILRQEREGQFLFCVSPPDAPRPTDFKIADEDPHLLIRFYF